MTKADKMFKEIGYKQQGTKDFENWENSYFDYIIFGDDQVDLGETVPYTKEVHLAIHEKMKELGMI